MEKKIKWGVIGSGGIARRRTIPEGIISACNAELVSVCSRTVSVNQEVAKKFRCKAASSIDDMLHSEIDAVYVATPVYLHYENVVECARAKKHVLCEKPLGLSVKETQRMILECKKAGVLLGTAFMMRFHSQHQEALRLIRDGKLGKLVYGRAQLSCWYPPIKDAWRQIPAKGGGGSLMDMGCHCIDLLGMFFGSVKRVSCFINSTIHNYRSEDSATVLLFFANGAMATVDTFFCIPDRSSKNNLELYGSKGSIIAYGTIGQESKGEMIAYLEEAESEYDDQQLRPSKERILISPEPVNTYRAEIEEFSQAIIEGRESSISHRLGLQSQMILEACYRSARTRKAVELNLRNIE